MIFTQYLNLCQQNIGLYDGRKWGKEEILLVQQYVDLYTERFKYDGLPDEFNAMTGKNKAFLFMLFFSPAIAFFKDTALGLQALPTTGMWKFDIAGNPTEWEVFGMNGYRRRLTDKESVLMFNDRAYSIPFLQLMYNVRFMVECDKTHRQNLKAQRQPIIAEIEEDEKKSAQTFLNKLNDFSDTIVIRKREITKEKKIAPNPYEMKAFESGKEFAGDKLASDYRYFHNRNLSILGYNNENIEKKERLLVDEVNSNNEVINSFYTTALNCQRECFEQVNKMFGYNIRVEANILDNIKNKGDNENERITALPDKEPIEERSTESKE